VRHSQSLRPHRAGQSRQGRPGPQLPRVARRMGRMSNAIHRALAAQLGDAVTLDPSGLPRVAPASTDALATALGVANEHQWRIRIEGNGTWMPADAPADLTVTTRRLDRITSIASADLVATVQSG